MHFSEKEGKKTFPLPLLLFFVFLLYLQVNIWYIFQSISSTCLFQSSFHLYLLVLSSTFLLKQNFSALLYLLCLFFEYIVYCDICTATYILSSVFIQHTCSSLQYISVIHIYLSIVSTYFCFIISVIFMSTHFFKILYLLQCFLSFFRSSAYLFHAHTINFRVNIGAKVRHFIFRAFVQTKSIPAILLICNNAHLQYCTMHTCNIAQYTFAVLHNAHLQYCTMHICSIAQCTFVILHNAHLQCTIAIAQLKYGMKFFGNFTFAFTLLHCFLQLYLLYLQVLYYNIGATVLCSWKEVRTHLIKTRTLLSPLI